MLQLADANAQRSELAEFTKESKSYGFAPLGTGQFSVQLEFFSGPMDLLLHLVSQQEVPIADVKMSDVAEQYLGIVNAQAEKLDLEKATEYLVIAATLLAIKSKSLLPAEKLEVEDIDNEWVDTRFFEDLRARLREYAVTKGRAQSLIRTPQLGVDTFVRVDRKALHPTPEMMAEPEDVLSLGSVFGRLLKRIGQTGSSLRIALEPISVVGYMMKILDSMSKSVENVLESDSLKGNQTLLGLVGRFCSREHLFEEDKDDNDKVRGALVGSFIAVLELVKRGLLSVSQEGSHDEIALSLRMSVDGSEFDADSLQSEFDDEESTGTDESKVVHMAEYRASVSEEGGNSEAEQSVERKKEVGSV